ncbi:MAG: hypothetical protein ACOC4K_03710 [Verrucomicrobiota bacterium]
MMKNNKLTLLALASAAGLAGAAHGQAFIDNGLPGAGDSGVFAYWDFNSIAEDGTALPADFYGQAGSTEIDFSGYGGDIDSFGGSTVNAQDGAPAGNDLALQNGANGGINGTFIEIAFDMTNLQDLFIDYKISGSSTGPNTAQWSYSINGTDFTDFGPDVGGANVSTTLASDEFGNITTNDLNGVSSAFLRLTFDGGSTTSSTGNNRIDNLTFSGTVVPEPQAFALIAGFLGLTYVMVRRRAHQG